MRDVFELISEIVRPVVPHDRMALGLLTEDRAAIRVYAVSGTGIPEIEEPIRLTPADRAREDWSTEIVRDVLVDLDPASDRCRHLSADGARSILRVPIFFEGHWQFAGGLLFISRTPNTYSEDDIPFARQVADQVALALSHQRLAEEARRAADARAEAETLEKRVAVLSEELASRGGFSRIVGTSKSWHDVLVQAAKVAPMETTVLFTGESGTGKEVVARAIHRGSPRAAGPFIALNCAALPDQLLESELFGYEKGAFTGATGAKPGRLEQAAGGTLFLDEIGRDEPGRAGEAPARARGARVPAPRRDEGAARWTCASSPRRTAISPGRSRSGEFREDLFYRLNVFGIHVPPLRERPEDILPLTEIFLAELGPAVGRPGPESRAKRGSFFSPTRGRATCGSCGTPSSEPRSSWRAA